jgi:parallel beta-helix repeat protein
LQRNKKHTSKVQTGLKNGGDMNKFLFFFVILAILLAPQSVLAATITVPDDHPTIQVAINTANPGDIVFVKPGVYNENIVVTKSIVLQGQNAEINGDVNADTIPDGSCISINSDNVVISGFVIHNCYNGITGETSNSVIKDNIIYDSFNYPGSAGVGILLWGENNNNLIKNNEIFNNDRQGIFIGHCDFAGANWECTYGDSKISRGNVISYNKIYNNGLYRMDNGPDESEYGIQLWGGDKNYIENNEIYGQGDWSFGQGIYLFDSNDNVIRDNDIYFNRYGISQWHNYRPVGNNYINFNNIYNNINYGARNFDPGIILDAENNWWGDATGPYHATLNPSGLGNKVSDNVDFDPWLNYIATVERKIERVDFLWEHLQIEGKWLWEWLWIEEEYFEGWIWDKVFWIQDIFYWMRQWGGFSDFWQWFDMPECPYECCVNDGIHKDKLCLEGFVCIENTCVPHICDEGERQCLGDELQECQNNQWATIETCTWGCAPENAHCNPRMSGWQCYRECRYNHNYIQACFDTYTWMKYYQKYCPGIV